MPPSAFLPELGGSVLAKPKELRDRNSPAEDPLADLYIAQGRFEDVVELTNGITATDDFSSFLLAQRGVAFRESGHHDAARESFKAALSRRSQPVELKHHTLAERALTYLREGKLGMARKDYERILAENPHHPGLAEALAALPERRTH